MTDCAALAELVIGEFDAAGVAAGVVVQEYLDGPQNDYLLDAGCALPRAFLCPCPAGFFPGRQRSQCGSFSGFLIVVSVA